MNFLWSSIVHQALHSLKACADKCYEGEHDIGQFYRVVLGQIAQDVWFKVDGYVVNHVGNITEEEIGQHVERKAHHAFPSPVFIDLGQKRYCPRKEISPANDIGQNNEESRVGHNDERRQMNSHSRVLAACGMWEVRTWRKVISTNRCIWSVYLLPVFAPQLTFVWKIFTFFSVRVFSTAVRNIYSFIPSFIYHVTPWTQQTK